MSLVNNEYLRLFLSFPRKRESRVLSGIWIPDPRFHEGFGNDRKVIIHQTRFNLSEIRETVKLCLRLSAKTHVQLPVALDEKLTAR
jgi:hypothetical protein